uniref:T9SS type A sorting domain-containing protein n=1 Tax=Fulvivirga sp. TaxID=1931237 RepID=UPI00404A7031
MKIVSEHRLIILLLILSSVGYGQSGKNSAHNLIYNPSFEECSTCYLNDFESNGPTGWTEKFGADFLILGSAGNDPLNSYFGSQVPHSGNSFVILGSNWLGLEPTNYNDGYQYIYQELQQPLVKGTTYYVEFFVSLAEVSGWGTNALGLYITNDFNEINGLDDLVATSLTPQIPDQYPGQAYLDADNWIKISGHYTPQSHNDKYIIIGNFKDQGSYVANPTAGYNGITEPAPYYFYDDVFVGEYSCCPDLELIQNDNDYSGDVSVSSNISAGANVNPFQASGEVVIQSGSQSVLKAGEQIVLAPGFYALEGSMFNAKIGKCEKGIDDNQLNVSIDVIEDKGQRTLTASAANGSGSYNYEWNTGEMSSQITVPIGVNRYVVTVTDNNNDNTVSGPCSVRTGWGEYQGDCSICRTSEEPIRNKYTSDLEEESSSEADVIIYPNPSSGLFNIYLSNNIQNAEIEVFNAQGVMVMNTKSYSTLFELNLNHFEAGVYIVLVKVNSIKKYIRVVRH